MRKQVLRIVCMSCLRPAGVNDDVRSCHNHGQNHRQITCHDHVFIFHTTSGGGGLVKIMFRKRHRYRTSLVESACQSALHVSEEVPAISCRESQDSIVACERHVTRIAHTDKSTLSPSQSVTVIAPNNQIPLSLSVLPRLYATFRASSPAYVATMSSSVSVSKDDTCPHLRARCMGATNWQGGISGYD